jgi:hypothetical protein
MGAAAYTADHHFQCYARQDPFCSMRVNAGTSTEEFVYGTAGFHRRVGAAEKY